jgi:hypothetical protein
MMKHTRDDVVNAVRAAFPEGDAATLLGILDCYGVEPYERERERVQLAIVALSEGSEDKLRYLVGVAKTDYRDVLYWQETGPLSAAEGRKLQQEVRRLLDGWDS